MVTTNATSILWNTNEERPDKIVAWAHLPGCDPQSEQHRRNNLN